MWQLQSMKKHAQEKTLIILYEVIALYMCPAGHSLGLSWNQAWEPAGP